MKRYFSELENIRVSLEMSVESIAKVLGIQPITYANWKGGVEPSESFQLRIANGYFFLSILQLCNAIPAFETSKARNSFYKSLANNPKISQMIKAFGYLESE